jgi:hypothetical protein
MTTEEMLAEALEHMKWCGSCAEHSWEDCGGGRAALSALAAYDQARAGQQQTGQGPVCHCGEMNCDAYPPCKPPPDAGSVGQDFDAQVEELMATAKVGRRKPDPQPDPQPKPKCQTCGRAECQGRYMCKCVECGAVFNCDNKRAVWCHCSPPSTGGGT